jgi:hypothetical protein
MVCVRVRAMHSKLARGALIYLVELAALQDGDPRRTVELRAKHFGETRNVSSSCGERVVTPTKAVSLVQSSANPTERLPCLDSFHQGKTLEKETSRQEKERARASASCQQPWHWEISANPVVGLGCPPAASLLMCDASGACWCKPPAVDGCSCPMKMDASARSCGHEAVFNRERPAGP